MRIISNITTLEVRRQGTMLLKCLAKMIFNQDIFRHIPIFRKVLECRLRQHKMVVNKKKTRDSGNKGSNIYKHNEKSSFTL